MAFESFSRTWGEEFEFSSEWPSLRPEESHNEFNMQWKVCVNFNLDQQKQLELQKNKG